MLSTYTTATAYATGSHLSFVQHQSSILDPQMNMANPQSLERSISPPPVSKRRKSEVSQMSKGTLDTQTSITTEPSLAAIEAGSTKIRNHLHYFSQHLHKVSRPSNPDQPRIPIPDWINLYEKNQHSRGRHFVIHQHNHPVAGLHYDLRLQFSETSTISFAVPYGVPGNVESKRQGRMAVETRVHCLWVCLFPT
jgi:hypothetical protein